MKILYSIFYIVTIIGIAFIIVLCNFLDSKYKAELSILTLILLIGFRVTIMILEKNNKR